MTISLATDAAASTASPAQTPAQSATQLASQSANRAASTANGAGFIPPAANHHHPEQIRHLLFGTTRTLQTTIRLLHKLGYAEPNDWSRPIATGRPGEMMAILTKRVKSE
ncbi:MAG: hypothetical protein ACFB16_10580 [Phormidesmis sp.]